MEGEDGIGKTALVGAFAVGAAAAGARVMAGACLELGSAVPYLPFTEGLRGLLRGLPDAERASVLGPAAPIVEPILHPGLPTPVAPTPVGRPGGGAGDGGETIDMARLELFESLLRLAERLTARGPLVVILDDLHWADRATLDLVAFLGRNLQAAPLLMVMTTRSPGAGGPAIGAFAAALDRHAGLERIELGPLAADALGALLAADAGAPLEPELVRAIARRSGGNPLFALELRRWTSRTGAAGGRAPGSAVTGSPRLRDLVAARLADLTADARGVLRLASAAGRLVDDDLLITATGLPPAQVSAGLRAAVAQGLLVPAEEDGRHGYIFRHDLVREAVDAELLPGERARLHEAYAVALAAGARRRHVDHGELAQHWDAAGQWDRAYAAHVEAGMAARRVLAFEAAQQHLERALALWPRVPDADDLSTFDRQDLRHAAAQAAALAGDHARAVALEREALADFALAAATAAADDAGPDQHADARAADAREVLRRSLWESGEVEAALVEAEAALDEVPADAGRARAVAITHLAGLLLLTGNVRRARTLATEAVELARAGGWREELALAGGIVGWSLLYAGRLAEGLDWIRRGWQAAQSLGEPRGRALADDNLARALELAGERAEAARLAVAGAAAARRDGLGRTYGALLAADAARLLRDLGRSDEARTALTQGTAEAPVGPGRAALVAVAARLSLDADDLAGAAAALDGLVARSGAPRDVDAVGWLLADRAELALRQGRPDAALELLRAATTVGARPAAPPGGSTPSDAAGDRTRSSLVVLGASLGTLLALGARAVAEWTLQLRATAAPPEPRLAEDRRRVQAMVAWLSGRTELAAGFAVDLALARAELARADGPADATTVDAWRAALAAAAGRSDAPAPAAAAYAALRLAEALVVARDAREGAGTALRDGLRHATAANLTALEGDLRTLARRARLQLVDAAAEAGEAAPADAANPFGLTDRELEVLRLVAAGCTNREIGEQLFMSPKTASVHVSAILGKLGVPGRLDAALLAQQVGLVDAGASSGRA